jgi:hypothetical protein
MLRIWSRNDARISVCAWRFGSTPREIVGLVLREGITAREGLTESPSVLRASWRRAACSASHAVWRRRVPIPA